MNKKFTILMSGLLFTGMAATAQLTSVDPVTPGQQFNPSIPDVNLEFDGLITSSHKIEGSAYDLFSGTVALSYTGKDGEAKTLEIPELYNEPGQDSQKFFYNLNGNPNNPFLQIKISDPNYILQNGMDPYAVMSADADTSKNFSIVISGVEIDGKPCATNDTGITNGITVDNGTITLTFEFPEVYTLEDIDLPKTFYQYWKPGDESAVATLTFSGPIVDANEIQLWFSTYIRGEISENDKWYYDFLIENPKAVSFDGNTVKIDFAGINFSTLASQAGNPSEVTLVLGYFRNSAQIVATINGSNYQTYKIPFVNEEAPSTDEPGTVTPELPAWTANPANDSELIYFDGVGIHWGWNNLELVDATGIQVTFGSTALEYTAALAELQEDYDSPIYEDGLLVVNLDMLQTEAGSYKIVIPAGTVNVIVGDGKVANEEIVLNYTVAVAPAPELPLPTVTPEEGTVEDLSVITLTWTGYDLMKNSSCEDAITMTLDGTAVNQIIDVTFTGTPMLSDYSGTTMNLSFSSELTQNGKYVITIPAGYLLVATEDYSLLNEEIVLTYTVDNETGITSIAVDGKFSVYNANGQNVLNTTDVNAVKNLSNGLYIINGKKVMIGK